MFDFGFGGVNGGGFAGGNEFPSSLNLSRWWRDFRGFPWHGSRSRGVSGSSAADITTTFGSIPPTSGTPIGAYGTLQLSAGGDKLCRAQGASNLVDVVGVGSFSGWVLSKETAVGRIFGQSSFNPGTGGTSTTPADQLGFCNSYDLDSTTHQLRFLRAGGQNSSPDGMRYGDTTLTQVDFRDGVSGADFGTFRLAQFRFIYNSDMTFTVQARVNNAAWTNNDVHGANNPTTKLQYTNTADWKFCIGGSDGAHSNALANDYALSSTGFYSATSTIVEMGFAQYAMSDLEFSKLLTYARSRYKLALT